MSKFDKLYVVLDSQGQIVHQSNDPSHIGIMEKYVKLSVSAGDNWELVEFCRSRVIDCSKP